MIANEWQWEPIDQHLANLLAKTGDQPDTATELLTYTVKLLSHQLRQGDVCLKLAGYAGQTLEEYQLPPLTDWLQHLRLSSAVGLPGEAKPLILDTSNRLYFQRYWDYEHRLVAALLGRLTDQLEDPSVTTPANIPALIPYKLSEQQTQAVLEAANSSLSIITGGPGTGKTSSIVSLLLLLFERNPASRIAVAAPTGKAAARIQQALNAIDISLSDHLKVSTLHRLLGFRVGSVNFRHHQNNPLPYDTVIVDEASMIDLAMMCKLVTAVKTNARLVLLGDADQLVSVESGAVFGELCSNAIENGLRNHIHRLDINYRFEQNPGIGKLADTVNNGNSIRALELLDSNEYPEVNWGKAELNQLNDSLFEHLTEYFKATTDPVYCLQTINQFQLLCAHRKGKWGVDWLNQSVENWLKQQKLMLGQSQNYAGKPIIISSNNYQLDLFNGDIGVLTESKSGKLMACFSQPESGIREVSLSRLTSYETAWALTVHQSQGSEFDHVLLVLPEDISPVLSRELIYTAITRARKSIQIMGARITLEKAIHARTIRHSGIAEKLEL